MLLVLKAIMLTSIKMVLLVIGKLMLGLGHLSNSLAEAILDLVKKIDTL